MCGRDGKLEGNIEVEEQRREKDGRKKKGRKEKKEAWRGTSGVFFLSIEREGEKSTYVEEK